jgi:superoxide dismutase, Cu-Zn family
MMNVRPALILGLLCLAGCATTPATPGAVAVAKLKPTAGNNTNGIVTFTQYGDKVAVEGTITGLTPGAHGFHVHENGDCSAPDATSAGSHFNPSSKPHGAHSGGDRHGGDLGNLQADQHGNVLVKIEVEGLTTAAGKPDSVVGRALIVHADPDDFKTQPTGNSGKRVACAVIAPQ